MNKLDAFKWSLPTGSRDHLSFGEYLLKIQEEADPCGLI